MRILVVGGAGYIGSHAARHLTTSGHEVVVYDDLSTGHRRAVPFGALVVGTLTDRPRLVQTLRDEAIEAVMHFAAHCYVGESVTDPGKYWGNNVVGSWHLLEAMREAGVKSIVFSSTTATYGEPDTVPIPETTRQEPINPYGMTKLVIERMLEDYRAAYGFSYAALRYFNAAGAAADGTLGEDHTPETHLIPLILQTALRQRQGLTIFGDDYETPDGTCIRDYVHVEDLATAHRLALEKLSPGTCLKLNLGTGRGTSVREVLDACRKVSDREIPVTVGPRRAGDPPRLIADGRLARETLGWEPAYPDITSIVETAWRWHRLHPKGYDGPSED